MGVGAALLNRKGCVLLQGRDAGLLEEPQHVLLLPWQDASVSHGHSRVNRMCSSQEHPLDSSCQSTNLSMCHLYEAVNSSTVPQSELLRPEASRVQYNW